MGANTLQEFLNENLHRNYPIKDSSSARDTTDKFNIPSELIADIRLVIPGGYAGFTFYISQVVVRRYTVDIRISCRTGTHGFAVIGWFYNIDTEADAFRSYTFSTVSQTTQALAELEDTTGVLVAGIGKSATVFPGEWSFDENSTPLVETAIASQLTKFRSLQIGDEIFTGNIVLKEGDNVSISSSYDAAADTTTITFSAQEIITEEGSELVNDDSLIDALTALYGAPIVTINEMPPAEDGNFTLRGADCINVAGDGSSGLRLTNPCGEPCCDKETYLASVYEALNQLNSRHVRLEDFLKGSVVNLDTIIGRLKDMENSIGLGGF